MVFENLSVFQNVLFWFACAGLIVLVAYLICFYAGFANAKRGLSDDIDNPHENFQTRPFIANAFSLKGSIVFLAIFSALGFLLSLCLPLWLALILGAVVGAGAAIGIAFADRDPLATQGEVAIVSESIPPENAGKGKIIQLADGVELSAISTGKGFKKGKRVIIAENKGAFVVVKKYKRR